MANELSGLTGWKLLKAIRGRKEAPRQNEGVATVTRKNADGATYVRLPGSTIDTPVNGTMTASVEMGQTVGYRIDSGRLSVIGNVSSPAVGQNVVNATVAPVELKADRALQEAERAHQAADAAENDAARARTAAESAETDAARAADSADIAALSATAAQGSASQAATAAQGAQASAGQAATAAQGAQQSASIAASSAASAASDASSARADATRATTAANSALNQLAVVEDVAGVLEWVTQHGEYELTEDVAVDPTKVYWVADQTQPTGYRVVAEPTASELSSYYELTIDEALSNYVSSHLALTDDGLYVVKDGSSWKTLTKGDGWELQDPQGNAVVDISGSGIGFNAEYPQYIGNDDAYVVFTPEHVESGETVPATVTIGGRVVMGGTQTLAELMHKVDNTLIYDTACTYNQQRTAATIEAHLYRGGVDVRSEYPENCFTWWLKSEDWVQGEPMVPIQSNGNYSCTVPLANVGYGATVVGKFKPPNDSIALTDDDDTLTDSNDTPVSVRTPSGDYVRVSDLSVETTVFDTDKLMVIGSEDEHLVTIETLKDVFGDGDYERLTNRPMIESVTLTGDKAFTDLGIFRRDSQNYDIPDDYTLTSTEINSLWVNAQPIGA